jgi:hypothetical protein
MNLKYGKKIVNAMIVVLTFVMCYGFIAWRAGVRNVREYDRIVTDVQRSAEDMRGLVDNLVKFHKDFVPAFLPQHLWCDEFCAASVVTAVNFTTGKKILKEGPAWMLSRVNKENLTEVYSRPNEDFAWETIADGTHQLKENFDRPIWLSNVLREHMVNGTTNKLFIVGYHYSLTHNAEKVWAAKADRNTHVMLLLGRYDGKWYGYHMLHDHDADTTHPFLIAELSDEEMTKKFNITNIWGVSGTDLASKGSAIMFAQDLSPYTEVKAINALPGMSKVNIALFGDTDQFPRIVKETDGVYAIAQRRDDYKPASLLGFVGTIPIRYHTGATDSNDRTAYGQRGQCVEFANRYLVDVMGFKNLTKTGNADSYFYEATPKGLKAFHNGSATKPEVGDLIIFDRDSVGSDPGHIAAITEVRDDAVCIAQQNGHPWHQCLKMTRLGDTWSVAGYSKQLACVGWSRIASKVPEVVVKVEEKEVAIVAPTPKPAPAVETTRVIKTQKVARGLRNTVRAVVARTPGANLKASFACNDWDFSKEATHKIFVGQTWKVCAWTDK